MRGLMLRVLPVWCIALATGCFLTGSHAPTPPPRTATHAYWHGATEVLSRKPPANDMRSNVHLVREQTDALRELSTEGVDAALVAAVEEVIGCEEEVLRIASLVDDDPAVLKRSQSLAVQFADANKKAADAKKKLKALRGDLNARHGGGFAW